MKLIDCITFFDNNFIFEVRYNILKNHIDYFIVCESKYDHKGRKKPKNFILKDYFDKKKIKYFYLEKPFPKNNDPWENQAIQREFILENLDFANSEDYIFFSDPDEIPNPKILNNFNLKKKYGIFLQDCFNYKFNLFNPYESPWEGTRVVKKKNLKSIDFMRQKVKSKNLNYSFFRFDKERNLELFRNGGWHFNNIMSPEKISLKLKTFAHTEFSDKKYSSVEVIKNKIKNKIDLFERGHIYEALILDSRFPDFILNNRKKFNNYIIL
jgi:beta-1,4-mannosyl-glycoprotein beta-1,4-N-acetylglucosaminyltransferase